MLRQQSRNEHGDAYRIYGQIRAQLKKNSYFATHTTKVSSSGSLCSVICQQPSAGMLRTVFIYAPSWCAQQQEAFLDWSAVSGGAGASSLLPVTVKSCGSLRQS